jgi:hypothetical protein
MKTYYRDVLILTAAEVLIASIRLESTSPISAFAAIDKVSRELPSKPGESRLFQTYYCYCGGAS